MFCFLNDHLGTPQKIVNNSGQVVWAAAYLPFGKAQVTTETVANNLRFPGQYYDAESGLHYNWHRYYDPETGRYITADPIGLAGGINLYVYVMGNPLNRTDRKGLSSAEDILYVIPIVGTGYNIFATPDGANIDDYQIMYMSCSGDRNITIDSCRTDVAKQAATYAGSFNKLLLGHGVIDLCTGGVLMFTPIAIPAAVTLALDGVLDTAVTFIKINGTGIPFIKINNIGDTGKEASEWCQKLYDAKCSNQ